MAHIIENDKIVIKKDCKKCIHLKMCKFHDKATELFKSSTFYGMTEYPEWNNNLKVFELHSSCQHFALNFKIPHDLIPNLEIDEEIIQDIVRMNKPFGISSHSVNIKNNLITFSFGKEKLEKNLQDYLIESGIKFSEK